MANFRLKVFEEQNSFVTLILRGELQQNTVFNFLAEVERLIDEKKYFQLWDFESVTQLEPETLQYIIDPVKECLTSQGAIYFLNASPNVAQYFIKSGFTKLKNLISSREEAKYEPMNWLPEALEKSLLQSIQTLIVHKHSPGKDPFKKKSASAFNAQDVFGEYSMQSVEATIDVPQEEFSNSGNTPKTSKYSPRFLQETIQIDESEMEEVEEVEEVEEFEEFEEVEDFEDFEDFAAEMSPVDSEEYSNVEAFDVPTEYDPNSVQVSNISTPESTVNISEEEMSKLSTMHATQVNEELDDLHATQLFEEEVKTDQKEFKSEEELEEELTEIRTETQFKVLEKIASGGMGKVYKANLESCQGFEKTVAIKTILPEFCDDPKFVKMFINEAKLVADLVHDNIVQIYQLGKFQKGYFITMEYIEGKDLLQFKKRHRKLNKDIPIELVIFIISRICRALDFAHTKADRRGKSLQIIHRDVSPQNIMMNRAGVVKLTDFGIVKAKSVASSAKKQLAGKLQYMSPEVARFGEVDHRADLYSLGAVFYELVTQQAPIGAGRGLNDSLRRIIEDPIIPPREINPKVTPELEQFILTCLQKSPERRYQNAKVMLDYLEKYLYSGGYGPTNNTLAEYLKELFQDLRFEQVETTEEEEMSEISFASLAMKQGYITQAQVKECLIWQSTLAAEHGQRENIGSLLIKRGYIALDQLLELLKIQKIRVYKCSSCENQYNVVNANMNKIYHCKRCESTLFLVDKLTSSSCDGQFEG